MGEAGQFQARVVIIVEIVEARHAMALIEQAARQMIADEAGRSGHENGMGALIVHRNECPFLKDARA